MKSVVAGLPARTKDAPVKLDDYAISVPSAQAREELQKKDCSDRKGEAAMLKTPTIIGKTKTRGQFFAPPTACCVPPAVLCSSFTAFCQPFSPRTGLLAQAHHSTARDRKREQCKLVCLLLCEMLPSSKSSASKLAARPGLS